MLNPKIHVAIRSYRRAGKVETLGVVPFASVWVPESQAAEYRAAHGAERIVAIPDELDGDPGRKCQAILDLTPSPRKWTLILDDDISQIGRHEDGTTRRLDPVEVADLIEKGFDLADQLGVTMWGINQGSDALWYDTFEPFNLLGPILGPFVGHLAPRVRYDPTMLGKDDYDFWLQTIRRERRTLRLNKFHYHHGHGANPGGFVSMRTREVEERGVDRMAAKWGKLYACGGSAGGGRASGRNILNSKIRLPIPGC